MCCMRVSYELFVYNCAVPVAMHPRPHLILDAQRALRALVPENHCVDCDSVRRTTVVDVQELTSCGDSVLLATTGALMWRRSREPMGLPDSPVFQSANQRLHQRRQLAARGHCDTLGVPRSATQLKLYVLFAKLQGGCTLTRVVCNR
jgi:hypothetical protein